MVDLPAPFSPTRAWISPFETVRFTLSLAITPGQLLLMPRISTARGVAFSMTGDITVLSCIRLLLPLFRARLIGDTISRRGSGTTHQSDERDQSEQIGQCREQIGRDPRILQAGAERFAQTEDQTGRRRSPGDVLTKDHGRQSDKARPRSHIGIEDAGDPLREKSARQPGEESTGDNAEVAHAEDIDTSRIGGLWMLTHRADTQTYIGVEEQELHPEQDQHSQIENNILLEEDRAKKRNVRQRAPGDIGEA